MKLFAVVLFTLIISLPGFAKLKVMTTTFPISALVRTIGQDEVQLQRLLPVGVDLHHFEPKASVFIDLLKADLVLYNGLGLEPWLEKFLANNSDVESINLSQKVPVLLSVTNMYHAHHKNHDEHEGDHSKHKDDHEDHDHEHEDHDDHDQGDHSKHKDEHKDHHKHGAYDMHYWLNISNIKVMAGVIKDYLVNANPNAKAKFETNFKNLILQLTILDKDLQHLKNCPKKHFITIHNAFNYLAKAYNLTNLSLSSLHNETEISPKTTIELIEMSKKYKLKHVLLEPLVNQKNAMLLVKRVNLKPLDFDTLANTKGYNFVKAMRKNILRQLKIALAC